MKTSYTSYVPFKLDRDMTNDQTWDVLKKHKEAHLNMEMDDYLGFAAQCMDCWIRSGQGVHIYLTSKEFCDWISGCVSQIDGSYMESLFKQLNDTALVFHFPCGIGMDSFCALGVFDQKNLNDSGDFVLLKVSRTGKPGRASSVCRIPFSGEDSPADFPDWIYGYCKIALGVCMYLKCFPEAIRCGVPEDLKHPSHHGDGKQLTVLISEKVCHGGTHASPVAHFRKGHFRVLKSEKFTNKRFEVIFIEATFVKGKAVTVLSPEQVTD